ncbi:MAG TPA: Gfo/Idh/MocA family oxidoreductase [Nitrososphaerales archaeon]|nr:Gfo/Idh/MocA family oxidoreductase [Nitrososphaerales archaeon]
MKSEVGLGLIGAGAIGKVHVGNINGSIKGARLAAVADIDQNAAKAVAGDAKVFSDFHEMIRDDSVDAVIVCTPPFLKLEITRAAAEAGKAVFCEKPISVTLDEADKMLAVVKSGGIKFQVGYQRRFDNSYVRARRAMESGELGKLLLLKEHNRDPPGPILGWSTVPAKSGGIFLDTTSHDFDAVRWLSGSEVERVYAEGAALVYDDLRKNGDFDTTTVVMKLANGALAYVDSCYNTVYGFDARLEMLGTKAAVSVDIGEKTFAHVMKTEGTSNEYFDGFATRWAQAYRDEIADFVDCVRTGRDVRVGIGDGREALKIGLAARASIAEGRPMAVKRD